RDEPANGENDRPHGAADAACPRRRGDRMRRRATSSLPGLTRQSILLRKKMDARVKPAHDGAKILCRREFILALGGATATPSLLWPLAAGAQRGRMRRIGGLIGGAGDAETKAWGGIFLKRLAEVGWEGGGECQLDERSRCGGP